MLRTFHSSAPRSTTTRRRTPRLLCEVLEQRDLPSFTVNVAGDLPDPTPADGVCDSDPATPGLQCTLRAAIQTANAVAGADTIDFNIPGAVPVNIFPGSPLPNLTESVTVDGTTQPGFAGAPVVVLSGGGAGGGGVSGLVLQAGSSTVRGLVIQRFSGAGILLSGGSGHVVAGNYIGTDATGTLSHGNFGEGVYILNAPNNVIGGTDPRDRNVISGNGVTFDLYYSRGIRIQYSGTFGNRILGNYIGTDYTGSYGVPNEADGIMIGDSPNNIVGGLDSGAGNLISGNGLNIPDSYSAGIFIYQAGASGNVVQGNFIGTDRSGTAAVPNTGGGVAINFAPNNLIGGTDLRARNLISGHSAGDPNSLVAGVVIAGSDPAVGDATGNVVQGNYVGTDVTGTIALGNRDAGVFVNDATNTSLGGTDPGAGNLISGNLLDGIWVGAELGTTTGTVVQANFIGTDLFGTAAVPNGRNGVYVTAGSTSTRIGAGISAGRNVISGNGVDGVRIEGAGTSMNGVLGNYIGTDRSGTQPLGNRANGVTVEEAAGNIVGGGPAAGNVIAANGRMGVFLRGAGATDNTVQYNFIGTDFSGVNPLGNGSMGVNVNLDASRNLIGGPVGQGNRIAFNRTMGVGIDSGVENAILANTIHDNGALGIDLGSNGVTFNDFQDLDGGANRLQNFPILNFTTFSAGVLTVPGTLHSAPNTTFRVEFFGNSACDPSGFGEGQSYLGFLTVTTNAAGDASFTAAFSAATSLVTATATDPRNNTSEFARCSQVSVRGGGSSAAGRGAELVQGLPAAPPAPLQFDTTSGPGALQAEERVERFELAIRIPDRTAVLRVFAEQGRGAETLDFASLMLLAEASLQDLANRIG